MGFPQEHAKERFWLDGKKVAYSVRDGYALENGSFDPHPFLSCDSRRSWWDAFWRIPLPPKVMIFVWKAFNDYIETPFNLCRCYISTACYCMLCGFSYATTSHCLLFCSLVRHIWKKSISWPVLKLVISASFADCVLLCWEKFSVKDFVIFSLICWAIWREYCRCVHEGCLMIEPFSVEWIYAYADSVGSWGLTDMGPVSLDRGSMSLAWSSPPSGQMRLDVDAGCDWNINKFGVGVVVRDSSGNFVAAFASSIRPTESVIIAELLALRYGMDLCLRLGIRNVIIFSDCREAVLLVRDPDVDFGVPGVLALELSSFLGSGHFVAINHAPRSSMAAAHLIAKKAKDFSNTVTWARGCLPLWLCNVLFKDIG